ncbi:MAG TPA: HTH domain-containing protein, partial [Naasia sp.]
MSDSTTASRVLTLLGLLQTHRHWPGSELARRLGVTARTLRRDIDRVRSLGYRVESVPGVAGGYRLSGGAALPPLLLTDDEAVTMAIGLRVAATQGLADGGSTTLTALAKLEQVLPPALRERVNALGGHLQPARPAGAPVPPELLGQLALACRDRERLRFAYRSGAGEETRRVVEPHSLVAAERAWFLV